jgi:predicted DNA-binding transcriptional regulator YafY
LAWQAAVVRADRLVAILLLLQTRGQVTAAEVAAELEVSERTARRDLDALGMAGVPIYSLRGRNGGWRLAGGGRTDLSGLTEPEARALFLVAGPSSAATPEVRAALRKLIRALPESFRTQAEAASSAIVVDPVGWDQTVPSRPPPPHLDVLQAAVIEGRQVVLGYVDRARAETERQVHPLGLASKGTVWYLVAATEAGLRTFRVERVQSVEVTDEPVVRPDGFDLAEAWRLITDAVDQQRLSTWARGTADPGVVGYLRGVFGHRVRIGPAGQDGRVAIEMQAQSEWALARSLCAFGSSVEILEPPGVRQRLGWLGGQLAALYPEEVRVD